MKHEENPKNTPALPTWVAVSLLILSLVLLWLAWVRFALGNDSQVGTTDSTNTNNPIGSFEECVADGNPVLEIYPEQCTTKEGQTFIRDVSEDTAETEVEFIYGENNYYSISIKHPVNWKVEEFHADNQGVTARNRVEFTTSSGETFAINDSDGIGYYCESDLRGTVTYTVRDVVQTQTEGLRFMLVEASQYTLGDNKGHYIPVFDYPRLLVNAADGDVLNKTFTEEESCSPIQGPFQTAGLNMIFGTESDLSSPFGQTVPKEYMDNQEIRLALQSLKIVRKTP